MNRIRYFAAFSLIIAMCTCALGGSINVIPGTNVQAIINTNPGGTINFADGVYNVPKLIVSNVTLSGSVRAVLTGPANDYTIQLSGDNVAINGMTLAGGSGIDFNGHRKNINLTGTVISEGRNGQTGIHVLNGLENCRWYGVTFNVPGNSIGVYNWISAPPDSSKGHEAAWNAAQPATWINWTVENCTFIGNVNGYDGQNEGMHFRADTLAPAGFDNGPGKSTGGVFRNCTFTGFARCNIEYQGGATGTLFEGIVYNKPALAGPGDVGPPAADGKWHHPDDGSTCSNAADQARWLNGGAMFWSGAADASVGTICRHCKFIGDDRVRDGRGVNNAGECAGHGVQFIDNFVSGVNNAAILNTSTDGVIARNRFINVLSGGVVSGSNAVRASIHDNTATQTLTWDAAGMPFVGATAPPPVVVPPTTVPTTVPTPPTPPVVVSANGTVGLTVRDGSGVVWAVVGGSVTRDGVLDAATHGVANLLYFGGNVYQITATGQFWTLPGGSAVMINDPRIVIVPPTTMPATQPTPPPIVVSPPRETATVHIFSDGTFRATTQP